MEFLKTAPTFPLEYIKQQGKNKSAEDYYDYEIK